MRRWGLVLALLLSLGVNVGILATLAAQRVRQAPPQPPPAMEERPPWAERRPGLPAGGRPQERLLRLVERMGLEGEERRRFLALQRRFFATSREERWRLAELHRELRRELLAEAPRRARIDELLRQIGASYARLEGAMAENVVASRALLDDEQERMFVEFVRRLRAGQQRRFPPGRRALP